MPRPLGDAPILDADLVETAFRTGAPDMRIDSTCANRSGGTPPGFGKKPIRG